MNMVLNLTDEKYREYSANSSRFFFNNNILSMNKHDRDRVLLLISYLIDFPEQFTDEEYLNFYKFYSSSWDNKSRICNMEDNQKEMKRNTNVIFSSDINKSIIIRSLIEDLTYDVNRSFYIKEILYLSDERILQILERYNVKFNTTDSIKIKLLYIALLRINDKIYEEEKNIYSNLLKYIKNEKTYSDIDDINNHLYDADFFGYTLKGSISGLNEELRKYLV